MKKLSILLIGLLLVSGMAFAADVPVEPSATIEGSASVTFGIDLNDGTTGFYNDGSGTLTVTLVPEQDITVSGDDGIYGEITIEDFSFENGAVVNGTASAKIVVSPIEVVIYTAPDFDFDKAPVFGNEDIVFDNDAADNAAGNETDVDIALTAANGGIYGITVTIPVDPITVDLKFASDGDYSSFAGSSATNGEFTYGDGAATANTTGEYAIGLDVTVAVDPIDVGLAFTYGWLGAPLLGIGATVDVEVADVLNGLTAGVGVDGLLNPVDGGDFVLDADFTLGLDLTEDNADDDASGIALTAYFAPYAPPATDLDVDVAFSFTEVEAGGFADMIGASLAVELHDLLGPTGNDLNFAVLTTVGYNDGSIDFGAGFNYFSDEVVELNLSVALLSALTGIDNTTLTLRYSADDLTASGNGASANELGVVEFMTEVSF